MNVRCNDESLSNSCTGDYCERRRGAFVQGGTMAVEMDKSLINILKELK